MNHNRLWLADWRRAVAGLYHALRAEGDRARGAEVFRRGRDALFARHPSSPLEPAQKEKFKGLPHFPYDARWRTTGAFTPLPGGPAREVAVGEDGALRLSAIGTVDFSVNGHDGQLTLYWLEGYGGGLWLPFTDATSGGATYGGGRCLRDAIKGVDLGTEGGRLVLDFNHAYNPSCAHSVRWVCPLAPRENRLGFAVDAGEMAPGR